MATVAVVLAASGWYLASQADEAAARATPVAEPLQTALIPPSVSVASAAPSAASGIGVARSASPSASAASTTAATGPGLAASGPDLAAQVAAQRVIDALGLTRSLRGDQAITMGGRQHRVLGTKDVEGDEGRQSLLVVQDVLSGDVDRWQAGLRFALTPGTDPERYIRENPKLQRRFVGAGQAEVLVDAGDIAEQYRKLTSDPQVTSVRLLPLAVKPKPR